MTVNTLVADLVCQTGSIAAFGCVDHARVTVAFVFLLPVGICLLVAGAFGMIAGTPDRGLARAGSDAEDGTGSRAMFRQARFARWGVTTLALGLAVLASITFFMVLPTPWFLTAIPVAYAVFRVVDRWQWRQMNVADALLGPMPVALPVHRAQPETNPRESFVSEVSGSPVAWVFLIGFLIVMGVLAVR
jgi:hypothetical protein